MLNDELLHKWINDELTDEERKIFQSRPEYESLKKLYKNTEGLSAPNFDQEAMLSDILKNEKSKLSSEKTGRRVFLNNWIKYAVAAALVFLAGWFLFLNNTPVVYEMANAEKKEDLLPDQSIFYLNADSRLSYYQKTWKNDRTLQLNGEAFFTVKPGSTFTVETPTGNVQVLGTKFNVWSRGDVLDVKCTHGKVAVLKTDGTKIDELNPFDALRIEKGKAPEKYRIAEEENVGWTQGVTKLRNVTVSQTLEELERQYNIEINAGDINLEEIISCNFQHNDLELALKTALSQLGIDYEIKNKEVFLNKN